MNVRHWFRPPRHVLAIFVVVAVVSAAALAWLMWLIIEQDKTVELQRRQERLEQVADRAAAVMQAALAELDRESNVPPGVIAVAIAADGIRVRPPDGLLYYPESTRRSRIADGLFAQGEQAEFERNDPESAARSYARLASDSDEAVQAPPARSAAIRSSRSRLTLLFLAVVLPPAVTLIWLGLRLLEQDRSLEAQREIEGRETSADAIVRSLTQAVAEMETRSAAAGLPDGVLLAD